MAVDRRYAVGLTDYCLLHVLLLSLRFFEILVYGLDLLLFVGLVCELLQLSVYSLSMNYTHSTLLI